MKDKIEQRSPGSWSFRVDMGSDADGNRRQKRVTVRGTKEDARREYNRIHRELDTGEFVEPSKLTVAQYLEKWLTDYAKHNVTAKTLEGYSDFIRLHLVPAIGLLPLPKLQPLHIQAYYSKALESGRRDGKGGLSGRTVLHHHRVLKEALRQAVKWQLLARNPADAVEPPRAAKREMQVLGEADTGRLIDVARGTRLYIPILLAVTTGMRRGEILALRWEDLDLPAGTLAVRQAMERTRAGIAFKQPKTAKSSRVIALPDLLVSELIRHKGQQAEQRLLLGPGYQDYRLVVAQPDGTPMSPHALSMEFTALLRRSGLPKVRFHDTRHGHASQLGRLGVPVKVISERLGHSTVAITLDLYSHVLPGMQEDAARKIDGALRAAIGE